jgi:hypothetical protein
MLSSSKMVSDSADYAGAPRFSNLRDSPYCFLEHLFYYGSPNQYLLPENDSRSKQRME